MTKINKVIEDFFRYLRAQDAPTYRNFLFNPDFLFDKNEECDNCGKLGAFVFNSGWSRCSDCIGGCKVCDHAKIANNGEPFENKNEIECGKDIHGYVNHVLPFTKPHTLNGIHKLGDKRREW